MYWVVNPQAPGVLSRSTAHDIWAFGMPLPPGVKEISDDEVTQRVRAAIGRPVADGDSGARPLGCASADRRQLPRPAGFPGGRCLPSPSAVRRLRDEPRHRRCASTSAGSWQRCSPDGAARRCSQSYEQERRAVHQRTIAEAIENHRTLSVTFSRRISTPTRPKASTRARRSSKAIIDGKTREFKTLGVVLGSRYAGSPIIVSDGSTPPAEHHAIFQPSAHPGCLAPHAWMEDGSSLYDHFRAWLQPAAVGRRGCSRRRQHRQRCRIRRRSHEGVGSA